MVINCCLQNNRKSSPWLHTVFRLLWTGANCYHLQHFISGTAVCVRIIVKNGYFPNTHAGMHRQFVMWKPSWARKTIKFTEVFGITRLRQWARNWKLNVDNFLTLLRIFATCASFFAPRCRTFQTMDVKRTSSINFAEKPLHFFRKALQRRHSNW